MKKTALLIILAISLAFSGCVPAKHRVEVTRQGVVINKKYFMDYSTGSQYYIIWYISSGGLDTYKKYVTKQEYYYAAIGETYFYTTWELEVSYMRSQ